MQSDRLKNSPMQSASHIFHQIPQKWHDLLKPYEIFQVNWIESNEEPFPKTDRRNQKPTSRIKVSYTQYFIRSPHFSEVSLADIQNFIRNRRSLSHIFKRNEVGNDLSISLTSYTKSRIKLYPQLRVPPSGMKPSLTNLIGWINHPVKRIVIQNLEIYGKYNIKFEVPRRYHGFFQHFLTSNQPVQAHIYLPVHQGVSKMITDKTYRIQIEMMIEQNHILEIIGQLLESN